MFEQICNQYLLDLCANGTFIDADLTGVKEDVEISKALVSVSLNNNVYERQIIIKKIDNELTWNFINPIDENELNHTEGDWNYPNYQKRIVAPLELIMDDNGIKMYGWFQLNNLPVKTIGNNVYLYCNSILPQHQILVNSFGYLITVEDVSCYENQTIINYTGSTSGLTSGTNTNFYYSNNTDISDPGNTYFKFNNTNISNVTKLLINNIDFTGDTCIDWLNNININDNINIFKDSNNTIFGYYMIINKIENDNFFEFDLYHINSNGYFTDNDLINMIIG